MTEFRFSTPVDFAPAFRHHATRPAPALAGLPATQGRGVCKMTVSVGHLAPIVALLAGVLILIMPRLLNYIVAIYLIVTGIIGLGLIK